MELLILLGISVATAVILFFVWGNNKKKFMRTMIRIDSFIDRNDTQKELEAKVDKVLAELRVDLIAKAKEELNKL